MNSEYQTPPSRPSLIRQHIKMPVRISIEDIAKCLGDVAIGVGGNLKALFLHEDVHLSIKEKRNGKISPKEVRYFVLRCLNTIRCNVRPISIIRCLIRCLR